MYVAGRYYEPAAGVYFRRMVPWATGESNSYSQIATLTLWGSGGGGIKVKIANAFLSVTGGRQKTYLDRWGDRLAARTPGTNAGITSGVGNAVNSRRRKPNPLPGQSPRTNRLASALTRGGYGKAAKVVRRDAPLAAAVGGLVDVYILAKEGIYAACGIPPGVY